MTKLEDLLNSLITVIVRYHDSQPGVTKLIMEADDDLLKKKSRTAATGLLQEKDAPLKSHLEELIKECTKLYPGRRPFLHYIVHELLFLKSQRDREKSFEPNELIDYKNQVTQLLIDFRQLLTTSKSKTYTVKYSHLRNEVEAKSPVNIALSGCIDDSLNSYFRNKMCISGSILIAEVFDYLRISISCSDNEFKTIADELCTEHQNSLLVPELSAQLKNFEKLHLKQTKEFESLMIQSKEDQTQITLIQKTVTIHEQTISNLRVKISDLLNGVNPSSLMYPSFFGLQQRYGNLRGQTIQQQTSPSSSPPSSSETLDLLDF